MKILVTGGPVHGKLDAVKIITNKFRGGLMARLAEDLQEKGLDVVYLTTKTSEQPRSMGMSVKGRLLDIVVVHHDGIHDYMAKVLEIAPSCDGVVLGAAVANLIPANPLTGKFPSHDYKPGDIIPIDFTIAPRIIDEVKKVAPNTKLFGFKLLAGVSQDELVEAAYGVLLEAKCAMVFANQAGDLNQVQIVTKERGTIPIQRNDLAEVITEAVLDNYYRTEHIHQRTEKYPGPSMGEYSHALAGFDAVVEKNRHRFVETPEGYVFGTVAIRNTSAEGKPISFLTTGRGKNELEDQALVADVNHATRTVMVYGGRKATLNAPLLHRLFLLNPNIAGILHVHQIDPDLPTQEYAPSGTDRDTIRTGTTESFNVAGHGAYYLLTEEDLR